MDFFDSFINYRYTDNNIEYGFHALLSLFSLIANNSTILLFIGFFSVCVNLKCIYRITPYSTVSVLLYFSYFYLAKELNAVRAGLASALLFYAAISFYDKKMVGSIISFILAISVHITSILFVFPLVLLNKYITYKKICFVTPFVICFLLVVDGGFLLQNINFIEFAKNKIDLYSNSVDYSYAISFFDITNIKNISFVILSLCYWESLIKKYKYFKLMFVFFYSASIFRLLFRDFAIFAGRGYSTIGFFDFIIIPIILAEILGRRLGILVACLYSLIILHINLNYNTSWLGGISYF